MPSLNNLPDEVIQKIFSYLSASERGGLELTNKHFKYLSRDYFAKNLKRYFQIDPKKISQFYRANFQEGILFLYSQLYFFSKELDYSEMNTIIKAINEKNKILIEGMIIDKEAKIKELEENGVDSWANWARLSVAIKLGLVIGTMGIICTRTNLI